MQSSDTMSFLMEGVQLCSVGCLDLGGCGLAQEDACLVQVLCRAISNFLGHSGTSFVVSFFVLLLIGPPRSSVDIL